MSDTSQPTAEPTREETAHKLDQALVELKGDRKLAAEVLGLTAAQVTAMINNVPALRVKWSTAERQVPETDVEIIDRKPIAPALVRSEQAAVAYTGQEKSLQRNLAKLGFKGREIEAIQTMEEFAGEQFERTLSILHGALLKSSMKLSMMAEHIEETYLQDEGLDQRDKNMWWNTYFRILENLRLQNESAYKAALTRAVIKTKEKEREGGGPSGKAGFGALTAVQINLGDKK